ncbi:helix-hairpin-helix domain-containing protein [Fodinibius saliphilus]|uniref:helix-hairpin-helix domain-containing protein n=1 Tax=Fodinibius saliphilus TaxID=1920650 RepID=UPI001107D112|nr:helix-hairpin-helix domain-containing protein [Fodinibius saliphilus]
MNKEEAIKELSTIPGVGKSIANDLWNINIKSILDLKDRSPEKLYDLSNQKAGVVQDRCLLYVFRCAVYVANTPQWQQEEEKLKWWNWKDEE